MRKNIYEMLNEVDIDLEELKNEEFTEIYKNQVKKNFIKSINKNNRKPKKIYKKYILASSILIVSVCLFNDNFAAYAKEIVQEITYSISKAFGISGNLEDYTNIINKSVSKNGLEVSLTQVILNNDEIVFSYRVKSDKKLDEIGYPSLMISGLTINNKEVGAAGGGGSKQIDDYTQEEVMRFTLFGIGEDELKGEVDIKIEFNEATIGDDKVIKGPWTFKFKADGSQLALDTEEVSINKTIELESGEKLTLLKYTKNEMGEKIYTKFENINYDKSYDIYIKGVDDSGTVVKLSWANSGIDEPIFERYDASFSENVKNINLSVYLAENEDGYMLFSSDFKQVGEEFTIK
ncbi:MAG: DUF4179 domain-containing protein [Peptostreptococcaceae bacterium]